MVTKPNISIKNGHQTISDRLKQLFLIDKLNTKGGLALLFMVCLLMVGAIYKMGIIGAFLLPAAFIGVMVVYSIIAYPQVGILIYFTMAYLLMWFLKLGVNFPLGTLMDGMLGLFTISLFANQKAKKDWSIFKGPITVVIFMWLSFNILEAVNPIAESQMAWVYTVRTVAVIMMMYFIFAYYLNTKQFIRIVFVLWMTLAAFAAAYGCKQEYLGFFPFELNYLHSDPGIELLLFINGVWRKFSIFSDPVAFSYNMVTASLMAIAMLTFVKTWWKRIVLYGLVAFFCLAMLSSGTRGAYVLIPAGMLMLTVLKFNKTMLLILIAGIVLMVTLIFIPTSNQTLYRFQSAFKPSDDASFNLRKMNQKKIQPYIQQHPIGGGLGSTGEWGKKFAPWSYLASFPPDSGYVRVAVEMGWLGLLIFCTFVFTVLRVGILNYYSIRDPELKAYCLGAVLVIFALNVGNYPQEALVQYPSNAIFYLTMALITATKRLDTKLYELKSPQNLA